MTKKHLRTRDPSHWIGTRDPTWNRVTKKQQKKPSQRSKQRTWTFVGQTRKWVHTCHDRITFPSAQHMEFSTQTTKIGLAQPQAKVGNNLSDDLQETARWPNRKSKTQNKPQHKTRIRSARKTETFNSDVFDVGRLPTSQTPHVRQETCWRKKKARAIVLSNQNNISDTQGNSMNCTSAFNSWLSHCDSKNKHSTTQLTSTRRLLRKMHQQMTQMCFIWKNSFWLIHWPTSSASRTTCTTTIRNTQKDKEKQPWLHAIGTASHTQP